MTSQDRSAFYLGRWLVEPAVDRISDGDRLVHLEPKVMDLLVFLAAHPGEVQSRHDIIREVWGQEFLCDTTLSSSVAVLRRALRDDARRPVFIETIPKRGYRLIKLDGASGAARVPTIGRPTLTVWPVVSMVAITMTVVLVGVIIALMHDRDPPAVAPETMKPNILVTRFTNDSDDPSLNDLGHRASTWLIHALRATDRVDVVAQESEMLYQLTERTGGDSAAQPFGPSRGFDLVVTGSYCIATGSLRFRALVADARSFQAVRAVQPVDGDLDDPGSVIDELNRRIVGLVVSQLDHPGQWLLLERQSPLIGSYSEFVEALEAVDRGDESSALWHLRRALELDPDFTTPHMVRAGLTLFRQDNLQVRADGLRDILSGDQDFSQGQRQLMQCLTLGLVEGRWEIALQGLRELHNSYPQDPVVGITRAYIALAARRPQEAVEVLSGSGSVLSPLRLLAQYRIRVLTTALHRLGRFDDELELARQARELLSDHPLEPLTAEVRSLAAQGHHEELETMLANTEWVQFEKPGARAFLSVVAARELASHGHRDLAGRWAEAALNRAASSGSVGLEGLLLEALERAGHHEQALQVAEQVLEAEGSTVSRLADVAVAATLAGRRELAVETAANLSSVLDVDGPGALAYARSRVAGALGDRDEALAELAQALAQGLNWFEVDLSSDIAFAELLGDDPKIGGLLEPLG